MHVYDILQLQMILGGGESLNRPGCLISIYILCLVDRASLYNLVNRTNLEHSFS